MAVINANTDSDGDSNLPIVIAGGGCVGLYLAHLLTQSSIATPIIVIEPDSPDPTSTRAMAHQPPILPLYKRANLLSTFIQHGSFSRGICFRTAVGNGSKVIAEKIFKEGEPAQLFLPQGKFQKILWEKVEKSGRGEVKLGWKFVGFEEVEAGNVVDVQIANGQGNEEVIRARYLIGADGGHSLVRKSMGLSFDGETLPMQLVATDVVYDFAAQGFHDANFIVDEANYGLVGRIDERGLWRVSYGVSEGMSEEDIMKGVDAKLRKMMPDGGKGGFEVRRVAPYKAQQRCVKELWRGCVGLVGDAAHLTNPYAGLGLASGIADADSLAPILIRILTSQAADADKLFASWSSARNQKFHAVVDKPSRAAYARVKKRTDTDEDIKMMLEGDLLVDALKRGMPMMPPSLETKVDELAGW